jgi:hypothetical protein
VTVRIKVGAAARRALRRAPRKLTVRLALRYAPTGARPTTAVRRYRLTHSHVTSRSAARTQTSRGTR